MRLEKDYREKSERRERGHRIEETGVLIRSPVQLTHAVPLFMIEYSRKEERERPEPASA
jgi:hypothetical protein